MTEVVSRHSDLPVDPLFLQRWSPRAFTDEAIDEAQLLTFIEAARWAPSASNSQPWRFLYARRDTPPWPKFLGLLAEANQAWARKASALLFLVSQSSTVRPGSDAPVPLRCHSLDAGAAWASFALQATRSGWFAHGMAGIDFERVLTELNVPQGFRVEMGIAVGRRGDTSILPEALRAREVPSLRLPLSAIAFEGGF